MSQVTCGQMVIYKGYEKGWVHVDLKVAASLCWHSSLKDVNLILSSVSDRHFKHMRRWLSILEWDLGVIICPMTWAFISGSKKTKQEKT